MKLFAAFSKVEDNADGTLSIEGIASTESVDSDGEVVKAAAIEAAIPDFMRYGSGAMREMHQPLAAGTVDKAEVVDGKTLISGTVVDPVAITKVKTGVYKGFSIGGKVTGRDELNKKHVTSVRLVEISLVDRPANPDAVISMWKAETLEGDEEDLAKDEETEEIETPAAAPNKGDDFVQVWRSERDQSIHLKKADLVAHHKALDDAAALSALTGDAMGKIGEIEAITKRDVSTEERKKDAKDGHALPDGSFPIDSVSDLENAIQAYGRAKNKVQAKRHIIRRAKALGATDKLPDGWAGSTKKAEGEGDLSKALSLECVADMLQLLAWMDRMEDSYEAGYFWPEAVIPSDEMKTRFGSLLVEFGDLIAESLDMVLGSIGEEEATEAMQRGEMVLDLVKAGARHSRSDIADLQAAHDALVKLGADCGMEKHEGAGDLAKTDEPTDLSKALEDKALLQKAYDLVVSKLDEIIPTITELAKSKDEMAKEIEILKAQPMPAKTAGPMAVSKETDTIGSTAEPVLSKAEAKRMFDELPPEDRAIALIKVARENPINVRG
ncbi:HK97 family phage prohead protease [Rhizobium sp. RCAM05973]|uniref:HK97 family phage prohead protease n=1 Tax=Rhizobium sp. RCAM05973 TaxID=2994066 RepID=UPI0022EC166E|nr:HK97 family phage prohead protease [Rhizobium sp. RCAM05973]